MARTTWTDALIEEKVQEVIQGLGLNRMPSSSECNKYFGDFRLSNAITKKKGWYEMAKHMNLPVKESDTLTGKTAEKYITNILEGMGYTVEQMSTRYPYDLFVNGCVKVDVKSAHIYHGPDGDFYTFNIEKPHATCDVYVLVQLQEKNDPSRIMIVPAAVVPSQTQISMGINKSKYHQYTDRWDYIERTVDYWKKVI